MNQLSCEPAADSLAPMVSEAERYCIIVDDDPGICRVLSFTLQKLGFDTDNAESPASLDDVIARREPDLVFLDLGLGRADASPRLST